MTARVQKGVSQPPIGPERIKSLGMQSKPIDPDEFRATSHCGGRRKQVGMNWQDRGVMNWPEGKGREGKGREEGGREEEEGNIGEETATSSRKGGEAGRTAHDLSLISSRPIACNFTAFWACQRSTAPLHTAQSVTQSPHVAWARQCLGGNLRQSGFQRPSTQL